MARDGFRAKPANKFESEDWQATNEREDDQITPKAAAQSIESLQRWTLLTASISASTHRANEA